LTLIASAKSKTHASAASAEARFMSTTRGGGGDAGKE
jgi:hypothetical protein